MKRRAFRRIRIIVGVGLMAVAGLLLVAACRGNEPAAPPTASSSAVSETATTAPPTAVPDTPTALPGATSEPIAASVNGYTITQSYLTQTLQLNKVLGELSGAADFSKEETLQRLIRSRLILQGAPAIDEPTEEEVESFISNLERGWGVSDETVIQELEAVGVDRAFFVDTIQQLLTVEAAAASLEEEGHNLSEWLTEQAQDADIMVSEDLISAEEAEATPTAEPTDEAVTPTPTARPKAEVPDVAPSFTLDRAGGGTFALADQLEEGPVVLVFFEKCGWGPDRTQLVQLREEYQAFQEAGVEIVALAVSPLSAVESGVLEVIDPPFPLLADPEHEVAEGFGVYDLLGTGYAAPSVFVIDTDGSIVWSYVGESRTDRPSSPSILEHLP